MIRSTIISHDNFSLVNSASLNDDKLQQFVSNRPNNQTPRNQLTSMSFSVRSKQSLWISSIDPIEQDRHSPLKPFSSRTLFMGPESTLIPYLRSDERVRRRVCAASRTVAFWPCRRTSSRTERMAPQLCLCISSSSGCLKKGTYSGTMTPERYLASSLSH